MPQIYVFVKKCKNKIFIINMIVDDFDFLS